VRSISALLSERHGAALAELKRLLALMEGGFEVRSMPEHLKLEFMGGCLFSIGILSGWRVSADALAIADRIEPFSPMHGLNADQLRAMYYSGQGDRARAEFYRQRVETRALQVGAAWQVVMLGPIHAHISSFWANDALEAKRAAAELERLSGENPGLRYEALRARATYLLLSGRYREVVETMQRDATPRSLAGWTRAQGLLARAHNRLGEHERARALCRAALAGCSDDDLSFVVMNLHVQIELALADAALADYAAARARSEQLLARHAEVGPAMRGALHEARARIALMEGDLETCRVQATETMRYYGTSGIASLRELGERLLDQLALAERGGAPQTSSPAQLLEDDEHIVTRLRLVLTHTEAGFETRARRGLQLLLELTGAEEGYVVSPEADGGVVQAAERAPAPELLRWAIARLDELCRTQVMLPGGTPPDETLTLGDLSYCAMPLGDAESAIVVLGYRGTAARRPSAELLAELADHLPASDR
jgi:tetratricopeptide (TPR) repeat protein